MSKFGSDELTKIFSDFYIKQVGLLEQLYKDQDFYHASGRLSEIYLLFFSLHSTGLSIAHLAKGKFLNESFILARSLIEKIINYLYLLYCDDEEYSNYLAYSKQKQFRMQNRSISIGELKVEIKRLDFDSVDLSKNAELKEAIEKFTSERGREITRWSSSSLSDRLSVIAPKIGSDISYLMLSVLGIYENASEAVHGTLYGVAFNIGLWQGRIPSTKGELSKMWNEQFSMIFLMLGTCIHTLIKAIHNEISIENIKNQSSQNIQGISEWSPWNQ